MEYRSSEKKFGDRKMLVIMANELQQ